MELTCGGGDLPVATRYTNEWLVPPWMLYVEYTRMSTWWTTGKGAMYMFTWEEWRESLSERRRREYDGLFPPPVFWNSILGHSGVEGQQKVVLWEFPKGRNYSWASLSEWFAEDPSVRMVFFWKPTRWHGGPECLGQWHMSSFFVEDERYCCAEQYLMAEKARVFGDERVRRQVLASADPTQMKQFGRQVAGFDQAVWDAVKYSIVLNGNYAKFTQNAELRDYLVSTMGTFLVEASPQDRIWGIGLAESDLRARDPRRWRGQNLLGCALMEVRDEIVRVWGNADALAVDLR